jgi:hypothetical protein
MGRACSTEWERGGLYRILVKRLRGRRRLGRPRHEWKDTIKMDPQEVAWDGID